MSDVSQSLIATSSMPADAVMTSVAAAATFWLTSHVVIITRSVALHSIKSRRILAQRRGSSRWLSSHRLWLPVLWIIILQYHLYSIIILRLCGYDLISTFSPWTGVFVNNTDMRELGTQKTWDTFKRKRWQPTGDFPTPDSLRVHGRWELGTHSHANADSQPGTSPHQTASQYTNGENWGHTEDWGHIHTQTLTANRGHPDTRQPPSTRTVSTGDTQKTGDTFTRKRWQPTGDIPNNLRVHGRWELGTHRRLGTHSHANADSQPGTSPTTSQYTNGEHWGHTKDWGHIHTQTLTANQGHPDTRQPPSTRTVRTGDTEDW